MSFYKDEWKRFKRSYHVLVLPGLLAYYFLQTQTQVVSAFMLRKKGLDGGTIHLFSITLLVCFIIYAGYLHNYLFWIKEQGKKVFLIPKYDLTPLSRKEIVVFDGMAIFLDVLKLLATMILTFFVFLGFELFQDYLCKKKF